MPWEERTVTNARREVLTWARSEGANVSLLCRRAGISRKTFYKWRRIHDETGDVSDRSRRPHHAPARTPAAREAQIIALRDAHPAWGGRKLHHVLVAAGVDDTPQPSTITGILRRHGRMPAPGAAPRPWTRFEAPRPNALWQMDYKGHIPMGKQRCHPLTILDDHSRFSVCLAACTDERATTVQAQLRETFARYGLPEAMLMDNGAPWGASAGAGSHTYFTAWLIRQGVTVLHGRPHHPQTQGKEERFHRTLKAEVLQLRPAWHALDELQGAFDRWRHTYNFVRPHEALGDATPASRYEPSPRSYRDALPPIEYSPDYPVRRVRTNGCIKFRGGERFVSTAFTGQPVALRPADDGVWHVYYCHQRIGVIDFTQPQEV